MTSRRLFIAAAAALACASAFAQSWPAKPVRVVVPFAAGGPADTLARFFGPRIAAEIGQQIIVDNKAGAGGTLGAADVARSGADGHSLLFSSTGALVIYPVLSPNMPYNPERDLVGVGHAVTAPMALVVSANSPFNTLADLVKYAKANPGKLNYASAGNGTTTHLGVELLKREAGLFMTHIPYRGAAPAITDLIGGSADLMLADVPAVLSFVKGGKLKALAVTWPERSSMLPTVPTTAEAGYKGVVSATWYGLVAPAKMPAEAITRINTALNKVLKQPETAAYLNAQGVEAAGGSADSFNRFIRAEAGKWGSLTKAVGAKLD